MKEYKVYCPEVSLIGQVGQTQSDISGRVRERTDFRPRIICRATGERAT